MASRPKVTQQKRARERARQERQQEKVRRREEAKLRRANTPGHEGAEDPDIAGIIPGPPMPHDVRSVCHDAAYGALRGSQRPSRQRVPFYLGSPSS